jgi:hypothetical protein
VNRKIESESPPETGAIETARPSSSVRRAAALVFYNIAATVVLLLALEGMANVYYAFHDAFAERPLTERLFTEYDRDLGWVSLRNIYLPNVFGPGKYVRTNSQRFRSDTDFTPTVPPGKTRIICSGDSFTFGYGVDNNHAWPQSLAAVDPNIQAVNMGQGGYGADQAYLWYKRDGTSLDHDIQIMAVITPDLFRMQNSSFNGYGKPVLAIKDDHLVTNNVPVPRAMEIWSPRLARAENALSKLSITRLLRGVFGLKAEGPATEMQKERNQETAKVVPYMLDDLVSTNRARNSVFVLVYLPVRMEITENMAGSWRSLLAEYARQHGVLFIDLVDDFHRLPPDELDKLFFAWGSIYFPGAADHYTEAGNAFVADRIYRHLLANPETAAKLHASPTAVAP